MVPGRPAVARPQHTPRRGRSQPWRPPRSTTTTPPDPELETARRSSWICTEMAGQQARDERDQDNPSSTPPPPKKPCLLLELLDHRVEIRPPRGRPVRPLRWVSVGVQQAVAGSGPCSRGLAHPDRVADHIGGPSTDPLLGVLAREKERAASSPCRAQGASADAPGAVERERGKNPCLPCTLLEKRTFLGQIMVGICLDRPVSDQS